MSAYTLYHIPGYSRVDHYGAEIVRRAGATHLSLRAARAAVAAAQAEMPDAMRREGAPRIDAISDRGRVATWL
jgi:hypothetical protein